MRVILPESEHLHALPNVVDYPLDSIAGCSTCDDWFYIGSNYQGFGASNSWKPVKIYMWRKWKRIKGDSGK